MQWFVFFSVMNIRFVRKNKKVRQTKRNFTKEPCCLTIDCVDSLVCPVGQWECFSSVTSSLVLLFRVKKKTPSKNAIFAWKDFDVEALLILYKAKHAAVFYRKNIPAANVVAASERRFSSGRYSNCSTVGPSILLDSLSFSLPAAARHPGRRCCANPAAPPSRAAFPRRSWERWA